MRNLNKNMMERGGLMIEALAMLGLIAVVTPTMYKKSAERTLEVEDINTNAIEKTAKKNGMLTLEQKGLLAVLRGETTLEEVSRVI
jgi:type II secretory ATPase GspE/PulE/Tfp pilus assembly ATPase PilB-like protein